MRKLLAILLILVSLGVSAQDSTDVQQPVVQSEQSVAVQSPQEQPRKLSWLRRTIRGFSYIDTNYVEPQHYNWSLMLQSTYNYDFYRLSTAHSSQSVTFAPAATIKAGPYFGWRWVFFGYTFDLRHVNLSSSTKTIDFSFYSAQIGADLYYRRTGSDYKVRQVKLGDGIDTQALEDAPFDGINVGITGFNLYYIFNHKRFSYPAAFNQSTCQKISCGSWMAGVGYLRNSIELDYDRLQRLIDERLPGQGAQLDSSLMFRSVKYHDINVSVGYAYNWVFARNWLFGASLSAAIAYKRTVSEAHQKQAQSFNIKNLNIANFNLDGIGRFGLVWNNTRWYAGTSIIVRAYSYKKERFAANNIFGSMNLYAGYNFDIKWKKRKK